MSKNKSYTQDSLSDNRSNTFNSIGSRAKRRDDMTFNIGIGNQIPGYKLQYNNLNQVNASPASYYEFEYVKIDDIPDEYKKYYIPSADGRIIKNDLVLMKIKEDIHNDIIDEQSTKIRHATEKITKKKRGDIVHTSGAGLNISVDEISKRTSH